MPEPLHVILVTDRKPGHENQLLALAARLGERAPVVAHEIDVSTAGSWRRRLVAPSLPATASTPDLILCAGRTTHWPALNLKRRTGARLVACMRPSARPRDFDLCLIPRHDEPAPAPNVETTLGAIVNVRPSSEHDAGRGVILIGGPSKRHGVSERDLIEGVREIVDRSPDVRWEMTSSRRTPETLERSLGSIDAPNLSFTPASDTQAGWVGERLARAGAAWITEDSVSMIFEALTSGCAVGVLPMPVKRPDRVSRGVEALARDGLVTGHEAWRKGAKLSAPDEPIDEASRAAGLILQRFFDGRFA
jgi:hypothetical protein